MDIIDTELMDVISLPVVEFTDSLRVALDRMRDANRSGVIATDNERFSLIEAADVVIALSKRRASIVTDLPLRALIHPTNVSLVANRSPGPLLAIDDLRSELDRSGLDFGLLAAGRRWTFIFTRRREIREILMSSPKDCYCDPRGHPVTGAKKDDPCPNGDGGTVCCTDDAESRQ